jgi:Tol biopolymer transport system component
VGVKRRELGWTMARRQRRRGLAAFGALALLATLVAANPVRADSENDIYVMNADALRGTKLTSNPGTDDNPAWSPDRNRNQIAFVTFPGQSGEIHVMAADGSASATLTSGPDSNDEPAWSSDGNRIVFQRSSFANNSTNDDIHVMSADGLRIVRLTDTPASDINVADVTSPA